MIDRLHTIKKGPNYFASNNGDHLPLTPPSPLTIPHQSKRDILFTISCSTFNVVLRWRVEQGALIQEGERGMWLS
jgi:hypothetical protein